MIGKSLFQKVEGEEGKDQWRYPKKLVSGGLIVCGSFLLLEHLFQFGGFDIELLGHEYLGIAMIAFAFLLSLKWGQLKQLKKAIRDKDWLAILDERRRKGR